MEIPALRMGAVPFMKLSGRSYIERWTTEDAIGGCPADKAHIAVRQSYCSHLNTWQRLARSNLLPSNRLAQLYGKVSRTSDPVGSRRVAPYMMSWREDKFQNQHDVVAVYDQP